MASEAYFQALCCQAKEDSYSAVSTAEALLPVLCFQRTEGSSTAVSTHHEDEIWLSTVQLALCHLNRPSLLVYTFNFELHPSNLDFHPKWYRFLKICSPAPVQDAYLPFSLLPVAFRCPLQLQSYTRSHLLHIEDSCFGRLVIGPFWCTVFPFRKFVLYRGGLRSRAGLR